MTHTYARTYIHTAVYAGAEEYTNYTAKDLTISETTMGEARVVKFRGLFTTHSWPLLTGLLRSGVLV